MLKDFHTQHVKLHIKQAGAYHTFITASVRNSINPVTAARGSYLQIARQMESMGMEIVHERVFGSLSVAQDVLSARAEIFHAQNISPESPVTYIEGNPPWGKGLAGILIHAVPFKEETNTIWMIEDGDTICGRGWKRNEHTYLILQDIQVPGDILHTGLSGSQQARIMIERAERILREQGASYGDVIRTWVYLKDILGWYAAFNKVRNEKYREFGLMPGSGNDHLLLPASTGIGGSPLSGAACTMDLIAVTGAKKEKLHVQKMTNPSQLDAFHYGSAFSRASVIKEGTTNLVEVSGTAAIDKHGVSRYPNDILAQIDSTFDKVQKLLVHTGTGLQDICSATVFMKRPEDAGLFYEIASQRGLTDFPCVCIFADICRDELLFEIDAEAIAQNK
jgi:enamine deaminase RidA (YjgF/YER057c/UK114 family)